MTDYQSWWEQQVLETCRRSWNQPDLTLEGLRARQAAQPVESQRQDIRSDQQFDSEREAEQRGITLAKYLRENH